MRFLFTVVFLSACLALPAHAEDSAPSVDEYANVRAGVLLPDSAPADAPAAENHAPAPATAGDAEAMTPDEITAAWQAGKFDLAAKHIFQPAENGFHQAEELLGIMYRNGQGVPKDPEKALLWLNKAAEAGRPLAEHHLGVIYFTGDGVAADPVRALMWLNIAIAHYPEGADKKRALQDRDNVSAQLTRRDRDRAMEFTREWLDKRGEGHLLDLQEKP